IYLDMNFWGRFRQHVQKPKKGDVGELLAVLRKGVRNKGWVCVFSGHTLSELLKHQDRVVHRETAALVDELGAGYCIATPDRLLNNEVDAWLRQWTSASEQRIPLNLQAWTRPAQLWSDYVPEPPQGFPESVACHLVVQFLDY